MSSEWISLGRVGIVPKGEYSSTTSYNRGDMVFYENASYIAIKNNLINVTPVNDNINWTMSMKAYEELPATNVYVNDTYNIVGNGAGSKGILQTFLDAVANKLGIFGESKDGLVPKPSATEGKFLCDDGTWKNPLQGVSSVFSLQLDTETGDLYAVYPDGMDAPQFEYDSDTGNLYYITSD